MNSPSDTRARSGSPGAPASSGERTTCPSGRWSTAYPRSSVAAGESETTRASVCASSESARSSRWPSTRRLRPTSASTSASRSSTSRCGRSIAGRPSACASPRSSRSSSPRTVRSARSRNCCTRSSSSPTSGTTFLAASVGVEARRSATRSSSGESGSWPIAETTGVRHAATVLTNCSSENGSRSSTLPPPRATTITSTSGSASSSSTACTTWATAFTPWTAVLRTSKRTAGQRRRAFSRTSRSAADARPQTRPMSCGRKGSGFFRSSAKSPSEASDFFNCSSRTSSSPMPTGRMSVARSESCPRGAYHSGLASTTTRAPSLTTSAIRSKTCRKQVTLTEMSCEGSRSVRKTTPAPGRRESWVICPSTQTAPSRSIHPPISRETSPTGSGASADVLRAIRASVSAPTDTQPVRAHIPYAGPVCAPPCAAPRTRAHPVRAPR